MQTLTCLPTNYHQSLPRQLLHEDLPNEKLESSNFSNVHPYERLPTRYPSRMPSIAAGILPTVSASLYDYPSTSSIKNHRNLIRSSMMCQTRQNYPRHHFDSYYYHPATLNRRNEPMEVDTLIRSGGGYQLTNTSQSSSNSSSSNVTRPLLPSRPSNNRVTYADLTFTSENHKPSVGSSNTRRKHPKGGTDYAILKFNSKSQIGKEIDV